MIPLIVYKPFNLIQDEVFEFEKEEVGEGGRQGTKTFYIWVFFTKFLGYISDVFSVLAWTCSKETNEGEKTSEAEYGKCRTKVRGVTAFRGLRDNDLDLQVGDEVTVFFKVSRTFIATI